MTSPPATAGDFVIDRSVRLHIVTGKGGTGKTTVAAALAMALAEGGRRILLVEVEGRQALAQLFDVASLPYEEQHLAAARGGGEVIGLDVDPERALLEYLDLFYNLKRAAKLMKRMGAIDFVTTLAPGRTIANACSRVSCPIRSNTPSNPERTDKGRSRV